MNWSDNPGCYLIIHILLKFELRHKSKWRVSFWKRPVSSHHSSLLRYESTQCTTIGEKSKVIILVHFSFKTWSCLPYPGVLKSIPSETPYWVGIYWVPSRSGINYNIIYIMKTNLHEIILNLSKLVNIYMVFGLNNAARR